MSERRCGVDEDMLDNDAGGNRLRIRKHTRQISMLCFGLLVLVLFSIYLLSHYGNIPAAPGQDQVGPGRNIGQ